MPNTKQITTVAPYDTRPVGRVRTVPVPNNWYDLYSPSGGSKPYYDSVLTDQTGSDGRFRPCVHEKYAHTYWDRSKSTFGLYTDPWVYEFQPGVHLAKQLSTPSAVTHSTILSPTEWDQHDATALGNMLPSMSDNFSLINFLIELKDFRRIGNAFLTRKNRIKELVGVTDGSNDSLIRSLKKRPLSSLSGSYLSYSFAWKPFVSDVISMWDKLQTVEQELQEIWRRAGSNQTRHFTIELDNYDDVTSTDLGTGGSVISGKLDGRARDISIRYQDSWRFKIPPVYHATCRYTYKVPGALDSAAKLRGWLDAFGVRLDPSIIWNAIPFSFIIDWVVDVNSFLRSFSSDNLGLHFTVEDFCSSLKYSTVTERSIWQRRVDFGKVPLEIMVSPSEILSQHYATTYNRRVGIPSLDVGLVGDELSAREFSLGAALVLANRKYTS